MQFRRTGDSSAIVYRLAAAASGNRGFDADLDFAHVTSSGGGFLASARGSGGKPCCRWELRVALERFEESDSLSEQADTPEGFFFDVFRGGALRGDLRFFDAVVEEAASRAVPLTSP